MTQKSCCPSKAQGNSPDAKKSKYFRFDPILHGSLLVILSAYAAQGLGIEWTALHHFTKALTEFFKDMWWGIMLGLLSVGLMNKIPREYFTALMGRGDRFGDILKAAFAGVVLDLCNHGILVIAGKLYERGLSTAQVITFLIASPWNSFSLTLILIALIGLQWTLLFILGSVILALVTGTIFQHLERTHAIPSNPNTVQDIENFDMRADARARLKNFKFTPGWFKDVAKDGWRDGQMILRWIIFGTVLAAALSAFVPKEVFAQYFGPTLIGLGLTLIAATVIEICSEGSAPIASEIMNTAHAPGNAFAFLMAGVATDYTEILVVREFTKSWKIALFIPLITVPQIALLGFLMNHFLHG
jgi:uncharacterized membrane protein YraQ (UPF0718 family)